MNNNAIINDILQIPELKLGLIDFTIRLLDSAKAHLLKMRESEIQNIIKIKKSNKLVR